MLEFVAITTLYTLLGGIPFPYIYAVSGGKFDALTSENHPHADGYIFNNRYTIFFTAFKLKGDVSFDIHI